MSIYTLIVEDDPMVSSINENFLQQVEGFQVAGTVKNGEEALIEIIKNKPDLLLLDLYMPKITGLELLKRIRQENIKLDVIMITAADSPDIIEESLRLGVVDYILKPFDFKRFQSALLFYKKRHELFQSPGSINQDGLDSLQVTNEQIDEQLPKGIDKVTLTLTRDTLKKAKSPLSIHELSSLMNISNLTIRKYLEHLIQNNEIILKLEYQKKGRPTKLYSYIK
ncbi:response regulator [Bacillus sp. Marseille-P3661]|uniref:response regulator n=1 Tax=Bacillus sp. Marseille-P3661 TaxID=1936234 RepID=UPI000C839A3C|nr:response regulator [Bacillus sp. Marseille-P3661]